MDDFTPEPNEQDPDEPAIDSRVPPSDMDAEAAVLSAVMVDPEAMPDVADFLAPEHFYSEAHRRIFEACLALASAGKPVDIVHVQGWLRDAERLAQVGGTEYLMTVLNGAPVVSRVRQYGMRVQALWRVRQVQHRARQAVAEAFQSGQEASKFCERTAQAFHELAYVPGAGGDLEPVRVSLTEAFSELHKASAEGRSLLGLSTGLDALDRILGGLHDGELTIIAARPGKGKSAAALQWAMYIAAGGHPAAFFSLEMPKKQLAMRAACVEAGVDVSHWRTGQMTPADWSRISGAVQKVANLPLHIDETPGLTAMGLRARLRRMAADQARKNASRPRLVVVDYLQLMQASGTAKRESRERAVAEIAQDLKEIAKEYSVPVVAPCQMNRQIEQGARRPRLSDLRESGNIEQAADTVVFIHETKEPHVVEFIVEKQRNGPNDIACARFEREYTRFANLPEEYRDWHDGREDAAQ